MRKRFAYLCVIMDRRIYVIRGLQVLLLLSVLSACVVKQEEGNLLSVTIEPQRYFVEQIAGTHFRVNCMVPAGQSPETYDPTPQQMVEVGKSLAYLRIGYIGFEQAWMKNIAENNPKMQLFDLSQGVRLVREEAEVHGDHLHAGGVDPHIWSSVAGARGIARNTYDALVALDPAHQADYEANYRRLTQQIDSTARVLHACLDPLRGTSFIIYHPALTYLAAEFGLHQLCIEWDGKEPSPAQLRTLVETARTTGARVVFVQKEFDRKNAERIAEETGCALVPIDPLSPDWPSEMVRIAKALAHGKAD